MFKPSATIHRSLDGKVKTLICSEDPASCIKIYNECKEPGEVAYIRKGIQEKQKKVESPEQIKARAEASENARAERAKGAVKEAESELGAAQEAFEKAKDNLKSLKPSKKPKQ